MSHCSAKSGDEELFWSQAPDSMGNEKGNKWKNETVDLTSNRPHLNENGVLIFGVANDI